MRTLIVLLAAALTFSGCLDNDNSTDEPMPEGGNEGGNMTAAQEPLHFTGSMLSIADQGTGVITPCQFPGSCVTHDFTVDEDNTTVEFTLVSNDGTVTGSPAGLNTDYDLFILSNGNQVAESTNPGAQDDTITMNLDAGTYGAQVSSWNDVDGDYALHITFSLA